MSYPAPDSKVYVTVTKWDGKCLLAMDANANQYIHWLDDDKRWEGQWREYVGTNNLVLLARVGRADGPRGRKMFVVSVGLNAEPAITLPQSEPTRSPRDVFKPLVRPRVDIPAGLPTVSQILAATDPVQEELDTTVEAIKHRPRPEPMAGDTSSINIRLEGELAAWVRQQSRSRKCTARAVVSKCVAGAKAYDS